MQYIYYLEVVPFLLKSIQSGLDLIFSIVILVDHLLADVPHHLDAWLVALDLRLQTLVFLHQILYTDKITSTVGGQGDGFLLADPSLLIIDVSHQLMHAVLLVQFLLAGNKWSLEKIHIVHIHIVSKIKTSTAYIGCFIY